MRITEGRPSKYNRCGSCLHPKKEQGVVAIIVALSLVGLVGAVGLALDLGKLYVAKTELQNSADACALAAARELSGANINQLNLAEAAGLTTGALHNVQFQGNPVSVESVEFSDILDGSYQAAFAGATAVNMRFARCIVKQADIANWFIQVLNLVPGLAIGNQTVTAMAVATLAPSQISTACGAAPVAVCSSAFDPTSPPKGTWLESVIGPPKGGKKNEEGNLTGNYMWADFTPPAGGASELGKNLTDPLGICDLPAIGSEVGEAGVKSSLANDWNSRFGIYQGNVKESDVEKGIGKPDFSGHAYTEVNWPSKFDAFADFKAQRANYNKFQGNNSTGLNTKGTIKDESFLKEYGADRRIVTVAVVDCEGFIKGTTAPVEGWACVLMLHPINNSQGGKGTGATRMYLEYLGLSNDPLSPCATTVGVPAGPGGAGPLLPTLVR